MLAAHRGLRELTNLQNNKTKTKKYFEWKTQASFPVKQIDSDLFHSFMAYTYSFDYNTATVFFNPQIAETNASKRRPANCSRSISKCSNNFLT